MGEAVFKVDVDDEERFLVWSSNVDAPTTFALTADEIVEVFVEDAVERATEEAKRMIERARLHGTSSRAGVTLADVVVANRAGPGERTLTEDEIMEFFVRRKEDPTMKALTEYRRRGR